jgi:hypothetical protein
VLAWQIRGFDTLSLLQVSWVCLIVTGSFPAACHCCDDDVDDDMKRLHNPRCSESHLQAISSAVCMVGKDRRHTSTQHRSICHGRGTEFMTTSVVMSAALECSHCSLSQPHIVNHGATCKLNPAAEPTVCNITKAMTYQATLSAEPTAEVLCKVPCWPHLHAVCIHMQVQQ